MLTFFPAPIPDDGGSHHVPFAERDVPGGALPRRRSRRGRRRRGRPGNFMVSLLQQQYKRKQTFWLGRQTEKGEKRQGQAIASELQPAQAKRKGEERGVPAS